MSMDGGDNAQIRTAREVERRPIMTEDIAGRLLQGDHAGTAGVNQRAVDVEKVEQWIEPWVDEL
jgi:hypothetical protein